MSEPLSFFLANAAQLARNSASLNTAEERTVATVAAGMLDGYEAGVRDAITFLKTRGGEKYVKGMEKALLPGDPDA